ncbi:MAG: sulfatase [Armatimonadetes bacterium]|nr:sulfatase [Armatimonadota bacterium]
MNIILLVFDSLRKDCVGCYGEPPWGKVQTPHLDALAGESLVVDAMYPESLPTLPTRRALYTGRRVYPFHLGDFRLKGDFVGAPGWGPIPEDQPTLAEVLNENGYRTAMISDVYHQFKPSKNYWRGFDQWMFLRGQETDKYRSGPEPTDEELYRWLPKEFHNEYRTPFIRQCVKNMYGRDKEEDYFAPRVLIESARWLEQNRDSDNFFLTIESFDPHEPWFVPEHYRRMYDPTDGPEWVISGYMDTTTMPPELLKRARANYSGLVTMCDRWLGHLYETMRALGLLENTILIVTADHGHSIGDNDFLGKRGYPSHPSVYDVPLIIRHPEGVGAGIRSSLFVQHTDLAGQVLQFAGANPPEPFDGRPFWKAAVSGESKIREHVTVAWGTAITVMDYRWWLNIKIDGTGGFLFDRTSDPGLSKNIADEHPDQVKRLYQLGVEDAQGGFPDYLLGVCAKQADAPGCSALVARE